MTKPKIQVGIQLNLYRGKTLLQSTPVGTILQGSFTKGEIERKVSCVINLPVCLSMFCEMFIDELYKGQSVKIGWVGTPTNQYEIVAYII